MRVLVTGTAGFIGFHLARRLLAEGHAVTGIDGMTPYYDRRLKERRHAILAAMPGFDAHCVMLEDADAVHAIAKRAAPEIVIHLAAQAGVRYSLENPRAYVDANLVGTFTVLELCRALQPRHLLFSSTSSVYGASRKDASAETDAANHPLSLYAATKKAGEAMAHSYAHLWRVPTTVFRFFTAYGPWGRPDMALYKFVAAMLADQPIDVYDHGRGARDFTYIDDLVEAIRRLIEIVPQAGRPACEGDSLSPEAPYRVVNIGGGKPVALLDFIAAIEAALGRPARRRLLPAQPGDVPRTAASTALLEALTGYRPQTSIAVGVGEFIGWYRDYYGL